MGLLNSALQIGRSALLSYESALQIVGNNVSSAASPDFTRLSSQLDPVQAAPIQGDLQPGAGVALTAIQRNIDEALEQRLRLAIGTQASAAVQDQTQSRIEPMFDELNTAGVGTRLTSFLNSFDELQNTPEDAAIRDLVVSSGVQLAESIRGLRGQLVALRDDLNGQIGALVDSADAIARKIARLNSEITAAEAGNRGPAAALRDQRDALLRDLAEQFDVTVREQPDGTVNVYIGSEVLVQGGTVRGLTAVTQSDGEATQTSIRFADTDQQVLVRGGQLDGLLRARDGSEQLALLDQLASAVIQDVNRIHADGQGLAGLTSATGATVLTAMDVPLDGAEAGLATVPVSGSFFITVTDDRTGTPVSHRIAVTADGGGGGTTLQSLVDDINSEVTGVTASVTSDLRLRITADDGMSFTFGHDGQVARADTSGVLSALGINTFFTGSDAQDIAVNDAIRETSDLLAAANVFLPGEGTNAGRIASLSTEMSGTLETTSISGFYRTIVGSVALRTAAARDNLTASSSVLESLQAQRESISGVNLDEEAISLVRFERAFQGTSRFIRVVDDLIGELVALVR